MSSFEQDAEFTAYLLERLDDCGLLDEWREDYQAEKPQPVFNPAHHVVSLTFNFTITPAKAPLAGPTPITEAEIDKLTKLLDDM